MHIRLLRPSFAQPYFENAHFYLYLDRESKLGIAMFSEVKTFKYMPEY